MLTTDDLKPPIVQSEEWWQLLMVCPARNVPIVPTASSDRLLITGPGLLCWFFGRETSGNSVVVELYDGTDVTGDFMLGQSFGANNGAGSNIPERGTRFRRGLFLHFVSGTGSIRGSVTAKYFGLA